VSQGLSIAESVLNMQRHMAEFGPLYVSFSTTREFMKWKWSTNPIYTGGGHVKGGHAVMSVGWGTSGNTDYWLLKNSWGSDWADKGFFKFKRGVNLDKIEDGAAAAMPTSDFKDWSPPVCRLARWNYQYSSWSSGKLASYDLTLKVECNKPCKLKIFTSKRLVHRDDIYSSVSGRNMHARISAAQAGKEVTMKKVNMLGLGFGRKGDMWVKISSDDGKGNKADATSFVTIPTAPW